MIKSVVSIVVSAFVSIVVYRIMKNSFDFDRQLSYPIEEDDVVADLPGARLHMNTRLF